MMIKKLLILTLVFGMASVSQAAWTGFVVGGSSEYSGTAGETITIDLIADTAWAGAVIGGVVEASTVDSAGQALASNVVDMGGAVGSAVITGASGITVLESGYQINYLGNLFVTASADVVSSAIAAGNVTISFDYTIYSGWDGTNFYVAPLISGEAFTYAEGQSFNVGATYSDIAGGSDVLIEGLHIVPEPMTICLLGLGGLFLRRRKR